jgi:hypothetical protein
MVENWIYNSAEKLILVTSKLHRPTQVCKHWVFVLRCRPSPEGFNFSVFVSKCLKLVWQYCLLRWQRFEWSTLHTAHYCTYVNLSLLVIKLFVEALSVLERKTYPNVLTLCLTQHWKSLYTSVFANLVLRHLVILFTKFVYFLPRRRGSKWSVSVNPRRSLGSCSWKSPLTVKLRCSN